MHPALELIDHRPWPMPASGWRWRQSWLELAFIHYRAEARELQSKLPEGVRLQEFDGSGWVGVVPFRMAGVRPRGVPEWLGLGTFPELNVRTYVEVDGKPGVWFFSLEAQSRLLVGAGRRLYGLPYHYADMALGYDGGWTTLESRRRDGGVAFRGRYRPKGDAYRAAAGSFDHWATERYCLYSRGPNGATIRVEVHHVPWPLQRAEVQIVRSDLLRAAGVTVRDEPPVCHFSKGVEALSFDAERAGQ